MLFVGLFFVILFLTNKTPKTVKNKDNNSIFMNYCAYDTILPIKGLFVLLVFFAHFRTYVDLSNNFYNNTFLILINYIGQLMVTMFFFYSGFGIYESYKRQGNNYIKNFFTHRFLTVWVSYVICVLFYLLHNIIFGKHYEVDEILLAFTGWTSIGNSNWFIFDTLILYVGFGLVFLFHIRNELLKILIFVAYCILCCVLLYFYKESYWWNTIMVFPFGMIYSFYKAKIDLFFTHNKWHYVCVFLSSIVIFILLYILSVKTCSLFYILLSFFFVIIVLLITMKIQFRSAVFTFLGKHVFSIYILQRLVFMNFVDFIGNAYVFFLVTFCVTIMVSYLYDICFAKIKKYVFEKFGN